MKRAQKSILSLAAVFGAALLSTTPAPAQTTKDLKAFHDYWGAFVAGKGAEKRCFAATKPRSTDKPASVTSRGKPFLLVSTFPSDNTADELSAVIGFEADNAKGVTLTIDGGSYPMFGSGENAWLIKAEDNAKVIQALKKGVKASVTATSGRGNEITDHYSLIGFTAALKSVAEACK